MSPYVRMVRTASDATAVQIVHSSHQGSRDIEHIGSAHDDADLEISKAAARQRLVAGRARLTCLERTDSLKRGAGGGPLPITSSRMGPSAAASRMPASGEPHGCPPASRPPRRVSPATVVYVLRDPGPRLAEAGHDPPAARGLTVPLSVPSGKGGSVR